MHDRDHGGMVHHSLKIMSAACTSNVEGSWLGILNGKSLDSDKLHRTSQLPLLEDAQGVRRIADA